MGSMPSRGNDTATKQVSFACPGCKHKIDIDAPKDAITVPCPACGKFIRVGYK